MRDIFYVTFFLQTSKILNLGDFILYNINKSVKVCMINKVNICNSISCKQNPYGNIQKIGQSPNGRTIYRVIDSEGQENGRLSVNTSDTAKFEQAYRDVMSSAPQIQKYVLENSSEKDIQKRRTISRTAVTVCGLIGAAIPIAITRKASTIKQILATVTGIVVGLSAGFAASLALTTPPGTFKFAKATRTISKLDIQPVENK